MSYYTTPDHVIYFAVLLGWGWWMVWQEYFGLPVPTAQEVT